MNAINRIQNFTGIVGPSPEGMQTPPCPRGFLSAAAEFYRDACLFASPATALFGAFYALESLHYSARAAYFADCTQKHDWSFCYDRYPQLSPLGVTGWILGITVAATPLLYFVYSYCIPRALQSFWYAIQTAKQSLFARDAIQTPLTLHRAVPIPLSLQREISLRLPLRNSHPTALDFSHFKCPTECWPTLLNFIASTYPSLQSLDLSDNQLTTLPDEIYRFKNLKTLSLDRNQLLTLPAALIRLRKLHTISLDKNPLEVLPQGLTRKGLTFLGETPNTNCKTLLKTQLLYVSTVKDKSPTVRQAYLEGQRQRTFAALLELHRYSDATIAEALEETVTQWSYQWTQRIPLCSEGKWASLVWHLFFGDDLPESCWPHLRRLTQIAIQTNLLEFPTGRLSLKNSFSFYSPDWHQAYYSDRLQLVTQNRWQKYVFTSDQWEKMELKNEESLLGVHCTQRIHGSHQLYTLPALYDSLKEFSATYPQALGHQLASIIENVHTMKGDNPTVGYESVAKTIIHHSLTLPCISHEYALVLPNKPYDALAHFLFSTLMDYRYYIGHAVALIRLPNPNGPGHIYMRANRGYGRKNPRIEFLIPNTSATTDEVNNMEAKVQSLLSKKMKRWQEWDGLVSTPGYHVVVGPMQHDQKVGNCSLSSNKQTIYGLMLYALLCEQGHPISWESQNYFEGQTQIRAEVAINPTIIQKAHNLYKLWSLWDRTQALIRFTRHVQSFRMQGQLEESEMVSFRSTAENAIQNIRQYAQSRQSNPNTQQLSTLLQPDFIQQQLSAAESAWAKWN